jgi:histidine triad (HIT) family protein
MAAMMNLECVFCRIVDGTEPVRNERRWADTMAFEPLNPVTPGHLLVIPTRHVRDFTEDPYISGRVMRRAAEIAVPPCNLITSAGEEATQSVMHLHVHIVPRSAGDGLALPWTGQADG